MLKIKEKIKKIFEHYGFRRYLKNTSWMFIESILRLLAGLLVGVYVARYLGPENYGIYSYVYAFVSIFSIFVALGLDEILVNDLVKYPNKSDYLLGSSFWLKFAGAIFANIIIAFTLFLSSNDKSTNTYIFIISSGLIFQSFEVIDFYYRSKVLAKNVSICKIIQLIFSSILKIFFVLINAGLLWFVIVGLIDYITLAISYYITYRLQHNKLFFRYFKIDIAKQLLHRSWPLILSGIMITIYMRIDQIMIKHMMTNKDVGLYSSAVKLSEIWYFIPTIITSSLFPAIINAKQKNEELFTKRVQNLYDLVFWLAIIVAIPVSIFSKQIITIIFGEEYQMAYKVLAIHIWQGIFVSLGVANSKWLIIENLQIVGTLNAIVGALSNVALNLILIPKMGIIGAAIATIISYGLAVFFFQIFFKKARKNLLLLLNVINPLRIFSLMRKN